MLLANGLSIKSVSNKAAQGEKAALRYRGTKSIELLTTAKEVKCHSWTLVGLSQNRLRGLLNNLILS